MNIFPGLDRFVVLEPDSHTYWDKEGRQYESVSKFLSRFYVAFDAVLISRGDKNLQKQWKDYGKERADEGTRIHNALEEYSLTTKIQPQNEDLRTAVISITSEYNYAYKSFNEQCIYNVENLVAGTCDKLLLFSSHPMSVVDIDDFKTNLKPLRQVDLDKEGKRVHKFMTGPLSHLIDSKLNRYALQLSLYAWMLEKKTGRRIGQLGIRAIPPNEPLKHYRIPVPYMKYEIEAMMLHKRLEDKPKEIIWEEQ